MFPGDQIYLSIEELSAYMHESKSSLYKKTCSNRIPHIKQGKKLLFKKDVIDKWLQGFAQPTIEEINGNVENII